MIVTIHQPEHLPWLGFFYKMKNSDLFVVLDSVQYRKNYFQNRNQIITNGKPNYVTVTVPTKGHIGSNISEMRISGEDWKANYLNKIRESYRKHHYFNVHFPKIESIILNNYDYIEELNLAIIEYFREFLGISTPMIHAVDLPIDTHKAELVFDICKYLKADTYLAGVSGRDYLNLEEFKSANIDIVYNEYTKYPYPQGRGEYPFVPYMSILDLVMNLDRDEANHVIDESFKLVD